MDAIALTKKLITLPSYVTRDRNEKPVADFLAGYLSRNLPWLKTVRQPVSGERYNILALPNGKPRILFISHMDTVAPAGNVRKRLTPQISGNRLYGLGSCDMKSGLAASVRAVQDMGPSSGAGLIFDCDEEYRFAGIRKIIQEYRMSPRLAVFPEPTDMKILAGCRGLREVSVRVQGKTAHAGTPEKGKNAITDAVRLTDLLKDRLTENDDPDLGKTTVNLSALQGGVLQNDGVTVQPNAVPDRAEMILDIRTADPRRKQPPLSRTIMKTAGELNVSVAEIDVRLDYPPYTCGTRGLDVMEKAVAQVLGNAQYLHPRESGYFEGPYVQRAWGCPSLAFGPGNTAHKPDENVRMEDVRKTGSVFLELIRMAG